ncbi:hypothetical protein COCMIDRAFT_38513 [Bipolaris oryzae ATCC 44560]|uniref:Uncharacterized protein n=1 Tax=Bipolaris oryzae ATCC 44560 TaxID=930090 RepID=W6ZIZ9_COCMI|nr:uncharacterized protein COCMIDRAFT_38513 [Bipolaris oryzae ATCC 44560]EUC43576.1 hypothetical protein COCMIDRAFT_38513 [Bipolaris oryzae ATCC 44560]
MTWSICFYDVLDADKLHESLRGLIEMENWRKLGGRLRLNAAGRVDVHIPQQFTSDRPAVHLTKACPYILDIPQNHCAELAGPDAPKGFCYFHSTDRPALTLHIITFSDCTFVTLTLLHCLTDGMGMRELVVNWSRVLQGDTGTVSPMADPADDPAYRLSSMPESQQEEPYFLEYKMLRGFSTVLFMCRFIADILFGPCNRQRTVVLPAVFVTRLREEAYEDNSSLNLSDSEIITTWLIRLVCSHMSLSSRRPLAIGSAVDPRGRYQSYSKSGVLPLYTDPSGFLLTVSNVSRARFQDAVDFKPAVVKRGLASQNTDTPSGKPIWCLNVTHPQLALPGIIHIQGKDHHGNYWVLLSTNDRAWEKINQMNA